ncbi:hypothetical protein F5Y19DRAFT_471970 [Xylariaceae sp. FL1651]|nr:hypothetical protein F5Y19DRAFT_471970 [Xylariaceae sp. FL1651]
MSHMRRAPLGDATDRVINASSRNSGKRGRPPHPEPNPLRAHPTSMTAQGRTASTSSSLVSKVKAPGTSGHANTRATSGLRTVTSAFDDSCEDKRFSQISNSSGASSGNRKVHIGPWQLGRTLGKGSAARVRLARHRTTQDNVAVKILAKNMTQLTQAGSMAELDKWDRTRDEFTSQRQMPLSIEREVAILKLIDHPHIVKLHDIWENRAEIYLVLEYMDGGDLFSYINQCGRLPEFEMMGYFRQILSALEYVHSFNICHRDLKPENILMQSNGIVKIGDFGMAAIQQSPTHALKTSCGSPHYAAPELVNRLRYQVDKVDIWSLGCILYATLAGRLPFDDPEGDVPRLLAKASKGNYVLPECLSRDARDLISKMLTVDPLKRIPIRKIWQHPLVRKYDDLDDLNDGGKVLNSRVEDKRKPVPSEELDVQILRQLKSIWHTFSEKQIAMQVMNTEPNDQKLFYWLLLSYREKRLENYDMDLTYSPSDYHHLRPTNWKRKFTTAEFPSRFGRTPSRFTVISTVTTNPSIEAADSVTDGGTTIQSYDPYKSSRIIEDVHASHAKIIVHRNGSSAKESSRSSTSHHARSSSFRSTSTHSRPGRGGRRIIGPSAVRASQRSLSSIQSNESTPYTRPASRRKRGVNFSHIQTLSGSQREAARTSASIAGDDTTYSRDYTSPPGSYRNTKLSKSSNGRSRAGTQSMANVSHVQNDGLQWNEEMREFSHSIAKDCDEAFNSSMLSPESYLDDSYEHSGLDDTATLSTTLATPTPVTHPWDRRPLPPAPPLTDSAMHEIMIAKKRAERQTVEHSEAPAHDNRGMSHLNYLASGRNSVGEDGQSRRIVSAPIYSQFSTQWGIDKIPLPSIHEKSREGSGADDGDKPRVVSAPAGYTKDHLVQMDDHTGLEFLAQQENTIRLVNSPSDKPFAEVETIEPLNIRKQMRRGITAYPQSKQELSLRQQYMHDEITSASPDSQSVQPEDLTSSATIKKKSSWFKRGSKDKDDVFNGKGESTSSHTDRLTYTSTNSSTGPAIPPAKKKSFNLAFWRNVKDQPQMQMSLAESDMDDSPSPEPGRMFNHPGRPSYNRKWRNDAEARNIEPHQNWLSRLFRVKPATKHLCFSISRRRARQEIVILLKEWRKYGIRDVQVDKKRNIVFARVGQKNYLNLKEVSFAAEIMTVIEHGKRSQLCIARFTQERGAASSFHKVVDTMNSVFSVRNLLVVEKRKIKMMIKTLNS